MGNFIGMVFGVLKEKGIDTSNMSIEEAVSKFNELNEKNTDNNGYKEVERNVYVLKGKTMPKVYPYRNPKGGKVALTEDYNLALNNPVKREAVDKFLQTQYKKENFEIVDTITEKVSIKTREQRNKELEEQRIKKDREETDIVKRLENIKNMKNSENLFGKTRGQIINEIEEKVNLGYIGGHSVYDNKNIFTELRRNEIEQTIRDAFSGYNTNIDFSRQSEATYVSIEDPNTEKEITIRIGSHYKSGVSGNSDIDIDYRNYKTLGSFKKDLEKINKILM